MHIYGFYKNGTDNFKSYIYLFKTKPALRAMCYFYHQLDIEN